MAARPTAARIVYILMRPVVTSAQPLPGSTNNKSVSAHSIFYYTIKIPGMAPNASHIYNNTTLCTKNKGAGWRITDRYSSSSALIRFNPNL